MGQNISRNRHLKETKTLVTSADFITSNCYSTSCMYEGGKLPCWIVSIPKAVMFGLVNLLGNWRMKTIHPDAFLDMKVAGFFTPGHLGDQHGQDTLQKHLPRCFGLLSAASPRMPPR